MFERSRQKRKLILQQLGSAKDRLPSAERRKLIENDYNQFMKTMQQFKHPRHSPSKSQLEGDGMSFQQRKLEESPSVKDLSPEKPEEIAQELAKEFYEAEKVADVSSGKQGLPRKEPAESIPLPSSEQKQKITVELNPSIQAASVGKEDAVQNRTLDLHNLQQENSDVKNSESEVVDQQAKIPSGQVNKSNTDSNNSEAIFFTSQFKDYLNKQEPLPSPPRPIQEHPQQERVDQAEPKQDSKGEKERTLNENPSGQSLAISNESSLKYSFNDSAIQDVITKKLNNELVLDSVSSPSLRQTLKKWAKALIDRETVFDLVEFGKQVRVVRAITVCQKEEVFLRLVAFQQLRYRLRLGNVKVSSFAKQQGDLLLGRSFQAWSSELTRQRNLVNGHVARGCLELKNKIFRTFKMLLFDRRINTQVDTYYLSKLFFALKKVAEQQGKRRNHKAYRCYFRNLKKRFFSYTIQGVGNMRREIEAKQIAEEHYYFALMRRYFEGWKEKTPRQQRFVRLALTTKNVLKETADHRLLQTRTIDFRQIR